MEIEIKCTGTENISIDKFKDLQGNLKELSKENYNKLKSSILKYGFSFPVFCWKDKNTYWILDAHQRIKTLKQLRDNEKYKVPDLPTVFISCKNKTEAKEKLLMLNSNYGKITNEGLYEFLNEPDFEIDFENIKMDLELPEVDLNKFEIGFITNEMEIKEKEYDENIETEKECPKCGYKWS